MHRRWPVPVCLLSRRGVRAMRRRAVVAVALYLALALALVLVLTGCAPSEAETACKARGGSWVQVDTQWTWIYTGKVSTLYPVPVMGCVEALTR